MRVLPVHQLHQGGLAGQQAVWHAQQFQRALVVVSDPSVSVDHHHALTQAAQRDFHQVGAGTKLLVGALQAFIGLDPLSDVAGESVPDCGPIWFTVRDRVGRVPFALSVRQVDPVTLHPWSQSLERHIQCCLASQVVLWVKARKHRRCVIHHPLGGQLEQVCQGRTGKWQAVPTVHAASQLKHQARHPLREEAGNFHLLLLGLLCDFGGCHIPHHTLVTSKPALRIEPGTTRDAHPLKGPIRMQACHLEVTDVFTTLECSPHGGPFFS